jgi:hypothetical protein
MFRRSAEQAKVIITGRRERKPEKKEAEEDESDRGASPSGERKASCSGTNKNSRRIVPRITHVNTATILTERFHLTGSNFDFPFTPECMEGHCGKDGDASPGVRDRSVGDAINRCVSRSGYGEGEFFSFDQFVGLRDMLSQ